MATKLITNLVLASDFIGIKPELYVQRSKRFNTFFGGLLCILIYSAIFIACLFFSQDLVYLLYPEETTANIYTQHPHAISLAPGSDSNFNFQFSVKANDTNLDLNYFTLIAESVTTVYCNMTNDNTLFDNSDLKTNSEDMLLLEETKSFICNLPSSTSNLLIYSSNQLGKRTFTESINIVKCLALNGNQNSYSNFNSNTDLTNDYCFSNKTDLRLFGNKLYNVHRFINLHLQKCTNCPSNAAELWRYTHNIKLEVLYLNYIYNTRLYHQPSMNHPEVLEFEILQGSESYNEVILQNLNIFTDTGYILESFRNDNFAVLESVYNKVKTYSSNLISVKFSLSPIVHQAYRKYVKIQTILAEVGGLFKSFVVLALIINYFHNRAKYYEFLFNELFSIEDLGKYFQYFDPNLRTKFHKFRDSIILKNTKTETLIRKADPMNFINHGNNSLLKTETKLSKLQTISKIDKSRDKLIYSSVTKHSKSSSKLETKKKQLDFDDSSSLESSRSSEKKKSEVAAIELNEIHHNIEDMNNMNQINTESKNASLINNTNKIVSKVEEKVIENQVDKDPEHQLLNNGEEYFHEAENYQDLEEATNFYISKIKHDPKAKESFLNMKKKEFTLTSWELFKFTCCGRDEETERKKSILFGGIEMIKERMEVVSLMKKNLELDRFKNLMLKDNQLLLLDSLSRFMLDPERIKLVDITNCTYEKFIDNYAEIFRSDNIIDVTLAKWVRTKYQLKL